MRMIAQAQVRDKSVGILFSLALLLVGCGGGSDTDERAAAPAPLPCPVVVDVSGWNDFARLADRITTGTPVDRAELLALATTPAFARWSASFPAGARPSDIRVANWLETTFRSDLNLDEKRKLNADRRTFSRSYRWSWEQRAVIDRRLHELDNDLWCNLDRRLRLWIPPDTMPDTLMIDILPTKPELRFFEDRVFVDSGVLAAGTSHQFLGQVTALVYRNRAILDGPSPLESEGTAAIAHLFRVITNEGVATWLEDLPHTSFVPAHPTLRKVRPVPEDYWKTAVRILGILDQHLPAVLDDPEGKVDAIAEIVRGAVGGGFINRGGWCMATTIADVLGEERLRQVAYSVPEFLVAYQEATVANTAPRPELHEVSGAYHRAMPPFSPATWVRLLPLLEQHFPPLGDPDHS